MKTSKSSGKFKSFKDLKTLIENKSLKLAQSSVQNFYKVRQKDQSTQFYVPETDEKELFLEAMTDVKPISRKNQIEHTAISVSQIGLDDDSDNETLLQLQDLVKFGKGFVVSDTPEYVEGTGYNINPEITKRLHRGDFSIQAHIDLHGLCVENARDTFEKFIKKSIATGKRAVLIVHGRGLSSPDKPVLKNKVIEWLTRGHWRKWVIAFSSARLCDGGAGATYVLLRQRPFTSAQRKRKK